MPHVIQEVLKCNWVLAIQKTVSLSLQAGMGRICIFTVPIRNELLTKLSVTNPMGEMREVCW